MTHNVHVDSVLVSGTASETDIDTVEMGANYPVVGKMVETLWHGRYNATAGGSKTFIFRIRKGGAMIDSVTVTTPAGGSNSEPVNIFYQLVYKTVGTNARTHSMFQVTAETGIKVNSNYANVNSTNVQQFILSVQISTAVAGNDFQMETGRTQTLN
jgi:hypothetical protein